MILSGVALIALSRKRRVVISKVIFTFAGHKDKAKLMARDNRRINYRNKSVNNLCKHRVVGWTLLYTSKCDPEISRALCSKLGSSTRTSGDLWQIE